MPLPPLATPALRHPRTCHRAFTGIACLAMASVPACERAPVEGGWTGRSDPVHAAVHLVLTDSPGWVRADLLIAVATGTAAESTRTFYTGTADLGRRSVSMRLEQPGGLSQVTMAGALVGEELQLRTIGSAFRDAALVLERDPTVLPVLARARAASDSAQAADRAIANHRRDVLPTPPVRPRTSDGYQTLIANVWVGKPLYLRTDYAYVGEIAGMENDHLFPDGTTRDAVLVSFASGSADWIPRKTLQQIYVTK